MKKVRLFHSGDNHLGIKFRAGRGEEPLRSKDAFRAFRQACEMGAARKPDLAVFSGDIFDSDSPPNKAIYEAIRGLSAFDCPVIAVQGNHDSPRPWRVDEDSPVRVFEALEESGILVSYKKVERFVFKELGIEVVAVPHISIMNGEEIPEPSDEYLSVLAMHGVAEGLPLYRMKERKNEVDIPAEILEMGWSYIALGHWHNFCKVGDLPAYYCGATETFAFGDQEGDKGFIVARISDEDVDVEFMKVDTRSFCSVKVDCSGLRTKKAILKQAEKALVEKVGDRRKIKGAVIRFVLEEYDTFAVTEPLSRGDMAQLAKSAAEVEVKKVPAARDENAKEAAGAMDIQKEWEKLVISRKKELANKGLTTEEVIERGLQLMEEAKLE